MAAMIEKAVGEAYDSAIETRFMRQGSEVDESIRGRLIRSLVTSMVMQNIDSLINPATQSVDTSRVVSSMLDALSRLNIQVTVTRQ